MRNENPSSLSERILSASLERLNRPLIQVVAGMLSRNASGLSRNTSGAQCDTEPLERVRSAIECLDACVVELTARQCEDVAQGVTLPANHARPARVIPFIDDLRELLYLAEEIARERSYRARREVDHE